MKVLMKNFTKNQKLYFYRKNKNVAATYEYYNFWFAK